MARKRRSHRKRRSRPNPVGLALNPRRRSRRSRRRHYRPNPFRVPAGLKRLLPLPPLTEIASVAGGSWAAGFLAPRVLALLPMLSKNVFGRIALRLAVISAATIVGDKVLRGKNGEMFAVGALANQVPHLTNDALSLVNMRVNFGLSDEEEELGYYYGEQPLMGYDASAELGVDTSAELGYYWGDHNRAQVG